MADEQEAKPGRFDSPLEEYPGYFTLPHPFLDRHMKVWWKHAIDPMKSRGRFDFELYDGEWLAAVELIKQFGAWAVEGVPIGDLDGDAVPMAVKKWVMEAADSYIYPFLPRPVLLKASGLT